MAIDTTTAEKGTGELVPFLSPAVEDNKATDAVIEKADILLRSAIDEDSFKTELRNEQKLLEIPTGQKRTRHERDRKLCREWALKEEDRLDKVYDEIGQQMIAKLRDNGVAVLKYDEANDSGDKVTNVDLYLLAPEQRDSVLAALAKSPKDFFTVANPNQLLGISRFFIQINENTLKKIASNVPKSLNDQGSQPETTVNDNVFNSLSTFVSHVPESFYQSTKPLVTTPLPLAA